MGESLGRHDPRPLGSQWACNVGQSMMRAIMDAAGQRHLESRTSIKTVLAENYRHCCWGKARAVLL